MPRPWTYYNEIDTYCVQWLNNLISAKLISPGEVDSRPIQEVQPDDVKSFARCHFFAGIAGWDYALQLAGWPDDLPIWTGSCPCQPFSVAGKRRGEQDERHLWPEFYRLIVGCNPPRIAGEQVASKDGREWLAGVRLDLEAMEYEVGCADLCAASVNAPHIRQRLFWVVEPQRDPSHPWRTASKPPEGTGEASAGPPVESGRCCNSGRLEHLHQKGSQRWGSGGNGSSEWSVGTPSLVSGLEHPSVKQVGLPRQPWEHWDVVHCLDGRTRRVPKGCVESGLQPLANGIPSRVAKIRALGNAIVPQTAAEVLKAWLECRP